MPERVAESHGTCAAGSHTHAQIGSFIAKTTISDDGVLTVFSGSAAISSPFAPQEQYVTAVYEEVMGQTPDAKGLAYWSQQLDPGAAISSVAKSIAHSDDYFHYLGRAADAGGLSYWLQQFSAGKTNEDLIAGFTGSAEYDKEHTP